MRIGIAALLVCLLGGDHSTPFGAIEACAERYPGLDRVGMSHLVGTPQSVILEQLEWLAKDVMPAFKGKVEASVPAD